MIFKVVKSVPSIKGVKRKRAYNNRYELLTEFLNMECKYATVDYEILGYSSIHIAVNTLRNGAEKYGLPIKFYIRNGVLYLHNTSVK